MGLLLVVALAGLAVLWLKHQQLAARVAELERLLGLRTRRRRPRPRGANRRAAPPPSAAPAAAAREPVASLIGEARRPPRKRRAHSSADRLGGWFERYVGGRLLIWIGGIALAVAGVLIVRFSVGLITPPVRLGLAAALGVALVAGGEVAAAAAAAPRSIRASPRRWSAPASSSSTPRPTARSSSTS